MRKLSVELQKSLKSDTFSEVCFFDSGEFTEESFSNLIDSVLHSDSRPAENDVVIFGCISNTVLKSSDGSELNFYKDGGKIHIEGPATLISDCEFQEKLELLHSMANRITGVIHQCKILIVPILPRHFDRCCAHFQHFGSPGPTLVSTLRDWSIFMSRFKHNTVDDQVQVFTLSLDKIFGRNIWQGDFTSPDGIHLNHTGIALLASAINFGTTNTNIETITEPQSIPVGVKVSKWRQEFRMNNPDLEHISVPLHLSLGNSNKTSSCSIPQLLPELNHQSSFKPRGHSHKRSHRGHQERGQQRRSYRGGKFFLSGHQRGYPY